LLKLAAAGHLEQDKQRLNRYPLTLAASKNNQGFAASGDTSLSFQSKPYGYCVTATNPRTSLVVMIKSNAPEIVTPGNCEVTVTTLSGVGASGYIEGASSVARFSAPQGIAISPAGIVYVSDTNNNRIRQISATGDVSFIAGAAATGTTNGTGSAARFFYPERIAFNGQDAVYVADTENNRIRRVTTSGVTTTFAGSGIPGFAEGASGSVQFRLPRGIAVFRDGRVIVADSENHRIRLIETNGTVSTYAGQGTFGYRDGDRSYAQFDTPQGVAVDSAGNVYVSDTFNNRIRKISSGGVVTTMAGNGTAGFADAMGTAAQFSSPNGLAVDKDGSVYVADTGNNRIRKISPSGVVTTFAGSGVSGFAEGTPETVRFNQPYDVAVDAESRVYVADTWNHRIRVISQ